MNTVISTPKARARLLVLTLPVLAVVAWALPASGGGSSDAAAGERVGSSPEVTATAAPPDLAATSSPAEPEHSTAPAGPPTEMPDGTPIPSSDPGTPGTVGEGDVVATVEPVSVEPAVALDETGDFGTGLTVDLTGIDAVQGVATAPGEIAAPALAVTVEASNDSAEAISLDGVTVFLSYGADRAPSTGFSQGGAPLQDDLAAGSSVTGIYVFAVPEDERDDVRVEISYTGLAPTVAFSGSVD